MAIPVSLSASAVYPKERLRLMNDDVAMIISVRNIPIDVEYIPKFPGLVIDHS